MDIRLQYINKASTAPIRTKQEASFVEPSRIIIGRERDCDLALDCEQKIISRQHARIDRQNNHYTLTDTSANGTYINRSKTPIGNGKSTRLSNNDIIRLGSYWIKFSLTTSKANQPSSIGHNHSKVVFSPPSGRTNEHFSAPAPTIPQDWDMSLSKQQPPSKVNLPSSLKQPINLSNPEAELIASLLKGLGVSADDSQLSPQNMLALGRCLRGSIAGIIKQRDHVENIKTSLCYDEKKLLKELKYASLADFATADDFLTSLVSAKHKTHAKFPLEVLKCQKEIMEDQAAIYSSFNKAIDSFREALSPFAIEKIYRKNHRSITEKLVPSIGKWDIYKKEWSEKCVSFKKTIKVHFQETIKGLHQQRIQERQVVKKKKNKQ